MTCPACGNALASGHERCAFCGALVAPGGEGALAPDHAPVTPPGRGRSDGLREMGALRKRSWKDEVNDRMRNRRQRNKPGTGSAELPLFADTVPPRAASEASSLEPKSIRAEFGAEPEPTDRNPRALPRDTRPFDVASRPIEPAPENVQGADLSTPGLNATELADLPLHPASEALPEPLPPAARVIDRLDPGKLEVALDEEPLV